MAARQPPGAGTGDELKCKKVCLCRPQGNTRDCDENPDIRAFDPNLLYRRTEEEFVFQIIFNNRTSDELRDVTVEYRIFKQRAAHMPGDRARRIVKRGTLTAEKIEPRRETTLETESFLILDTDREEWGPYNPRIGDYPVVRVRRTGTLDGVWIRIMDDDKVIREEYSSPGLPRRFNWSD